MGSTGLYEICLKQYVQYPIKSQHNESSNVTSVWRTNVDSPFHIHLQGDSVASLLLAICVPAVTLLVVNMDGSLMLLNSVEFRGGEWPEVFNQGTTQKAPLVVFV